MITPKEKTPNNDVIDFFNKNFEKKNDAFNPMSLEDSSDDEDSKIILKSKREQEYSKRFIDYERMPDEALLKSTEQLQWNRQSVS